MAMVTHAQYPGIEEELLDFGVVGPQDRHPAAEKMYVEELREFLDYLR